MASDIKRGNFILMEKDLIIFTENLREPLENRLNPLIYKEHEEFNFSPKRPACRQTGEANIYKKCP
jgi:hypothetical protein